MCVAYMSTIPSFVTLTCSPMPPDVRQRLRSLVAFREAFLMMFRYVVDISFYCILLQHFLQSSTTPINPPPATAGTNPPPSATHSDLPVSTTQPDSPSSMHPRLHILPFLSVSGAHALLRRILPRFHLSQPNTNQSTNLQQHSGERPASVHGLTVQVLAVPGNQVCLTSIFLQPINANDFCSSL